MRNFITSDEEQWAPLSDLMAALLLLFMLIAAISTVAARSDAEPDTVPEPEPNTIPEPETVSIPDSDPDKVHRKKCDENFRLLKSRFNPETSRWAVELTYPDAIRFSDDDVLFPTGSAEITESFKLTLNTFFPAYMNTIRQFSDDIREIRIEGHTSSEFKAAKTVKEAYFKNMELSQDRTREILQYVLSLPEVKEHEEWAKKRMTANGLSSSQPIKDGDQENKEKSRRVEFKLLAKSCLKAGMYGDN